MGDMDFCDEACERGRSVTSVTVRYGDALPDKVLAGDLDEFIDGLIEAEQAEKLRAAGYA